MKSNGISLESVIAFFFKKLVTKKSKKVERQLK